MYRVMGKVLVVAVVVFSGQVIHAAYSVSPFVIDHTVEQRDILTELIVVRNDGPQPVTLYATVNNISVGLEGGIEEFVTPAMSDRTNSLSSWLSVDRRGMDLQPGDTREIPLRFEINPQAQPGVYHAFIGFAPGRTRDDAEAIVKRGGAPGVIVNITIKDTSSELLKLSRFLVSRFVTGISQDDITYVVANTGDTTLTPQGDILLYNHRGEEVGAVQVNPNGETVSPGETKTFTSAVPVGGLLGKYKALLSVEYGTTQKASLNDTVFFYVLPWKKLAIMFVIFLCIALVLSLSLHRRYLSEDDDADHLPFELKPDASPAHPHDIVMKK